MPEFAMRDHGYDAEVIHEVADRRVYEKYFAPSADDVWLDAGAHIGTFSVTVAPRVKRVIAVEAHPENFVFLRENVTRFEATNVVTKFGALVPDALVREDDVVPLYVNRTGKNLGSHTVHKTRGRSTLEVPAVSIKDVLYQYGVTRVKLDVEGAEQQLLPVLLTTPINAIVMEWHVRGRRPNRVALDAALEVLSSTFDHVHTAPEPPKGAWYVLVYAWNE